MKDIFEIISTGFVQFGEWISLLLDIISVICIIIGIIATVKIMFELIGETTTPLHNRIRMKFGGWLVLALEFQLASDIVKTTLSPTYEHLIILGVVAVIRTFLNYYLNKELKEEMEFNKIFAETKIK
jgi:uncharacterized membrane protein